MKLAEGCRNITYLDISGTHVGVISDVLYFCSKLRVLKAVNCSISTHTFLRTIHDVTPELEELDVSLNPSLGPLPVISRLNCARCPKLRILRAVGIGVPYSETADDRYVWNSIFSELPRHPMGVSLGEKCRRKRRDEYLDRRFHQANITREWLSDLVELDLSGSVWHYWLTESNVLMKVIKLVNTYRLESLKIGNAKVDVSRRYTETHPPGYETFLGNLSSLAPNLKSLSIDKIEVKSTVS
jgi:hypothetical protein